MNRVRFSVGTKLMTIFVFFSIIIVVSGLYLFRTMEQFKTNIDENKQKYLPSIALLNDLNSQIKTTNELILIWIYVEINRNTRSKNLLDNLVGYKIPNTLSQINEYEKTWDKEQKIQFAEIKQNLNLLMSEQAEIMQKLENESDYSMEANLSAIKNKFGTNQPLTELGLEVSKKIEILRENFKNEHNANQSELLSMYKNTRTSLYLGAFILVVIAIFMGVLSTQKIIRPIKQIKQVLISLSKGILVDSKIKPQDDEIGDILQAINKLTKGLRETANFSQEIGKGNFTLEFVPLSEKDILGNSLITTKNNLQEAEKERKKNQQKEQQRNWRATGVAKFSDFLRNNSNNLDKFAYILISELVQYLEIQQGGFFLLENENTENSYLELKASYAYEVVATESKKIKPGETLVGQCFLEKESIYITEVPANYLQISSGLGSESPASILLVPMKIEQTVYGIVELASFGLFEKYKIDFVEKICESIASAISVIKNNEHTEKLLEESQILANQLSAQEEEMRQMLEEMQTTQEEMGMQLIEEKEREEKETAKYLSEIKQLKLKLEENIEQINTQNLEFNNLMHSINNSIGMAFLSFDGKYIAVNDKYLSQTESSKKLLLSQNLHFFVRTETKDSENYKLFWENLKQGKIQSATNHYHFNNKDFNFFETFTPIKNEKQEWTKIILMSYVV